MALDAAHDPDAGRTVLQCTGKDCFSVRRHTSAEDAFAAGWHRTWTGARPAWRCPDCWVPALAERLPPNPIPPRRFLDFAAGNLDTRAHAMALLGQLFQLEPERAEGWLVHVMGYPMGRAAARDWNTWQSAHLPGYFREVTMLAQHSSATNEHYTPPEITGRCARVMGGIDLDPASCAAANQLVQAGEFFAKEDNGLSLPWRGRVFVNPPGELFVMPGTRERVSQAGRWWAQLAARIDREVEQACFLAFNLELFRHAQAWDVPQPLDFAVCLFRHRIAYWSQGPTGELAPQTAPPHPSALVYLGPRVREFREAFDTGDPADRFSGRVFIAGKQAP